MNTRLIIHLTESWPDHPVADWVLLDAAGTAMQQGQSAPAHWPAAGRTEALLSAGQGTWLEVQLPPAARRDLPRLLSYALEERLVGDVDAHHLTLTHTRQQGEQHLTGVIAVSRTRITRLIAQFNQIGRPLHSLRCALQTLPSDDTRWSLTLFHGGNAVFQCDRPCSQAVDTGDITMLRSFLQTVLPLYLAGRDPQQAAPTRLLLRSAEGVAPLQLEQSDSPLALEHGPAFSWWSAYSRADELLHDEFAPRHLESGRWRRLRAPLAVGTAALAILFVVNLVDIWRLQGEVSKLEVRSLRLFEDSLPATPAVAPAAQLRRALDQLRRERGQMTGHDLLALLHAHVQAGGAAPKTMAYEDGKLRLSLPSDQSASLPQLSARMALYGVHAEHTDKVLTLSSATAGRQSSTQGAGR